MSSTRGDHDAKGATSRALAAAIASETERPVVLLELETADPSSSGDPLESALRHLEDPAGVSRDDCVELAPGLWRLAARRPETLRHLRRAQVVPALLDVLTQAFQFVVVGLGARPAPIAARPAASSGSPSGWPSAAAHAAPLTSASSRYSTRRGSRST